MQAFLHRFAEPTRGSGRLSAGTRTYTEAGREAADEDQARSQYAIPRGGARRASNWKSAATPDLLT